MYFLPLTKGTINERVWGPAMPLLRASRGLDNCSSKQQELVPGITFENIKHTLPSIKIKVVYIINPLGGL